MKIQICVNKVEFIPLEVIHPSSPGLPEQLVLTFSYEVPWLFFVATFIAVVFSMADTSTSDCSTRCQTPSSVASPNSCCTWVNLVSHPSIL
jgi:hypothetical protein